MFDGYCAVVENSLRFAVGGGLIGIGDKRDALGNAGIFYRRKQ